MDLVHSFSYLYKKTALWSSYKKAPYYLAAVAFFEACLLFPVPPDAMFIAMSLTKPKKTWLYAFITILFSILGSLLAYLLGYYAIDKLMPYLSGTGFNHFHDIAIHWLKTNDFWTTIIAIFAPVPYKFLGIIAGSLYMSLFSFLTICCARKVIRTTIVGLFTYCKGTKIDNFARLYIDLVGWAIILGVLLFLLADKLMKLKIFINSD